MLPLAMRRSRGQRHTLIMSSASYGMISTGFNISWAGTSRRRAPVNIALVVRRTRARPLGKRHGRYELLWLSLLRLARHEDQTRERASELFWRKIPAFAVSRETRCSPNGQRNAQFLREEYRVPLSDAEEGLQKIIDERKEGVCCRSKADKAVVLREANGLGSWLRILRETLSE